MGIAHLTGQLALPPQPEIALPLIQRPVMLASIQVPQPVYIHTYGLLLGKFSNVTVLPQFLGPLIPPHSLVQQEGHLYLECAAFPIWHLPSTSSAMHASLCLHPSRSTPCRASNITRSPVNKGKSRPTWHSAGGSCVGPRGCVTRTRT